MPRKLFLVAYDVREPTRLAKALKIVRGFACGGQKSAYECWLDDADHGELSDRLESALDAREDSIAFVPLSLRQPVTALGVAEPPRDPDYYYID
ncbi:MAG TPA: CRISPR-associated endonuclease Cas2 [Nevskiaceae bacterium]